MDKMKILFVLVAIVAPLQMLRAVDKEGNEAHSVYKGDAK